VRKNPESSRNAKCADRFHASRTIRGTRHRPTSPPPCRCVPGPFASASGGSSRSKRVFGQRWQAESAFSRHKRRLGSSLAGRSDESRERECRLRVLARRSRILLRGKERLAVISRFTTTSQRLSLRRPAQNTQSQTPSCPGRSTDRGCPPGRGELR
jgi:hypothetical protein